MKIECTCGYLIHDHTDAISHKAHFIPDGWMPELLNGLDKQIERGARSARQAETAAMAARTLLNSVSRQMWQCNQCGTLYMDDRAHRLVRFEPSDPQGAKGILAK